MRLILRWDFEGGHSLVKPGEFEIVGNDKIVDLSESEYAEYTHVREQERAWQKRLADLWDAGV